MSAAHPSAADVLRSTVAHQSSTLRKTVLQGGFNALPSSLEWKTPTFKLVVFVSSTFTDTQLERNYLMDELIFELREVSKPLGIQVIFVDMRWGVRDENSCDHKTWVECSNALNWCKTESMGIFFLSLQGDKYGYTPLPKVIDQDIFERHLNATQCTTENRELLMKWYRLDGNATPPEYSLRNLVDHNDSEYWSAFRQMLEALRGLEFDTQRYPNLRVGRSVTEWEVRGAFAAYPLDRDAATAYHWSRRQFAVDPANRDFCDVSSNAVAKSNFQELISFMESNFLPSTVQRYSPQLVLADVLQNGSTAGEEYIKLFKESTQNVLRASLDYVIQQKKLWEIDGCGVGLRGSSLREMLHHLLWAHEKCLSFRRREELVNKTMQLILKDPRIIDPVDESENNDAHLLEKSLSGVCACLVGCSGAGKTALMAKVASEVYKVDREGAASEGSDITASPPRPVIIRFCGTSPSSRTARMLVSSICEQIEFLFTLESRVGTSALNVESSDGRHASEVYQDLVRYFHQLLANHAVVLFIDSLDQLTDDDQGRSQLSFLKGLVPHPRTRVVVSCLPDEVDQTTGVWVYLYLCDTRLQEAMVPRIDVSFASSGTGLPEHSVEPEPVEPELRRDPEPVSPLAFPNVNNDPAVRAHVVPSVSSPPTLPDVAADLCIEEAVKLLADILQTKGRTLTSDQWELVKKKLSVEPTVLYINLAVDVLVNWNSTLVPPGDVSSDDQLLAGGVRNLIRLRFCALERDYGEKLVRACLGFITYSVQGVSDVEMVDLVSLHDSVLDAVFQYATPSIRRLPSHVWLRLKGALSGLIVEGEQNCLVWYHRQLRETAVQYLETEKSVLQKIMAAYFADLVDPDIVRGRRIVAQGWTLCGKSSFDKASVINHRRGCEASNHLLSTKQWERAEQELCSFEGVCGKIRSGKGFELVQHITALEAELKSQHESAGEDDIQRQELSIRWKRLQHYMRWLREDIAALLPDCLGFFTFSASAQPKSSVVWAEARDFIKQFLDTAVDSYPLTAGLQLGSNTNFDALLGKLRGHSGSVYSAVYSMNGDHLASGGSDGIIRLWDTVSGSVVLRLEGHHKAITSLSFSLDSRGLASGSEDCSVRVWDLACGTCLNYFPGYGDRVLSVQFCPHQFDEKILLASSSGSGQLIVWDLASGEVVVNAAEEACSPVYTVAFSQDGETILSGTDDGTIFVWETNTGLLKSGYRQHEERINILAFSTDGTKFISGSNDKTAVLWEFPSMNAMLLLAGHRGPVLSAAFFPPAVDPTKDGSDELLPMVVTTSWDHTLRLWNSTGSNIGVLKGHEKGVYSVAVNTVNKQMASASGDSSVHIWDISYITLSVDAVDTVDQQGSHTKAVTSVSISPDGLQIASASADCSIRIWSTLTGDCIQLLSSHSSKKINSVTFSQDGQWLASGGEDKIVRLWRTADSVELLPDDVRCLSGHTKSVSCVAFSPDSHCLASSSADCSVRIWGANEESTDLNKSLEVHKERVNSVAFNADGTQVVTTSSYTVFIQDVATGKFLLKLEGHMWFSSCAAFLPCARVDTNPAPPPTLLAISSSDDKSMQTWDIAHGSKHNYLQRFMGHSDRVSSVSVSDSGLLASSSWDRTVRLWDYTSRCVAVLEGHAARVNSIDFSKSKVRVFQAPRALPGTPGGGSNDIPEILVSGSDDGKVRLWFLHPLQLSPISPVTEQGVNAQLSAQEEEWKGKWLIHGVDKL